MSFAMRLILLTIVLSLSTLAQAKMYRWVDENGKVHYGDRIPAKYAQKQSQTLNSQGVVIEERNAPKTPEQLAAEQAKQEAEKVEADRIREQQRYDSFLISTYATQDQIIARRDDQLNILDSRIRSGEKSMEQNQASLDSLKARALSFEEQDKPIPVNVSKQIAEFKQTLKSSATALEAMRAERAKVSADFERDLNRWIELDKLRR